MKLLFLRGSIPHDRSPKELMYSGLCGNDDMFEHLACAIGDERCEIVYWNGNRIRHYTDKDSVAWVRKLEDYKPDFKPDVIFARGGFDAYTPFLKHWKHTFKTFYGAGEKYYPQDNIKYGLVLVDSEKQLHKAKKKGFHACQWIKPAAPIFKPMPEIQKEFDVCYIGDARFPYRAKKKNTHWFYKTAPSDLKILHLGWSGPYKPPPNVTVRRVERHQMPLEYAKCRVGIIPYLSWDSAPRTLTEMVSMGLPVVVAEGVNYANGCYPKTLDVPLDQVWTWASDISKNGYYQAVSSFKIITLNETPIPTVQTAADQIRRFINEAS